MRNKRGWIRVLEVFLAILIVMGALLVGVSDLNANIDSDDQIYEIQRDILELINKNDKLRDDIMVRNKANVKDYIEKLIPENWDFDINICDLSDNCNNPTGIFNQDVFVTEIMIAANLINNDPKKLKFFVWMK